MRRSQRKSNVVSDSVRVVFTTTERASLALSALAKVYELSEKDVTSQAVRTFSQFLSKSGPQPFTKPKRPEIPKSSMRRKTRVVSSSTLSELHLIEESTGLSRNEILEFATQLEGLVVWASLVTRHRNLKSLDEKLDEITCYVAEATCVVDDLINELSLRPLPDFESVLAERQLEVQQKILEVERLLKVLRDLDTDERLEQAN